MSVITTFLIPDFNFAASRLLYFYRELTFLCPATIVENLAELLSIVNYPLIFDRSLILVLES